MTGCDRAADLLWSLVVDRLGPELVEELFCVEHARAFGSYLFRHAGSTPQKSTYVPRVYSTRSGVEYFRPDGWVQLRVTAGESSVVLAELEDWPVAYHGTDSEDVASILEAGLRKPGELPIVQMQHGASGAGPGGAVYASPSLFLASHPVYSTFLPLGPCHWAQFVFKVRVRPGSFRVQRNTLSSSRHWAPDVQIDPNFEHHEAMEWVISDSRDVIVVGLMVRELGAGADPEVFGEVATGVAAQPDLVVERVWTGRLQAALRSGGFRIDNGRLSLGDSSVDWYFSSVSRLREIYEPGHFVASSKFDLAGAGLCGARLILFPSGQRSLEEDPCLTFVLDSELALKVWFDVSIGAWHCSHAAIVIDGFPCFTLPLQVVTLHERINICVRVNSANIPNIFEQVGNKVTWRIDASLFPLWEAHRRLCITSDLVRMSTPTGSIAFRIRFVPPHDDNTRAGYCWATIDLQLSRTTVPVSTTVAYRLAIADKSVRFVKRVDEMNATKVWLPLNKAVRDDGVRIAFRVVDAARA